MNDENKVRAYTAKEVREHFLSHLKGMAQYWASSEIEETVSMEDRLNGLLFAVLVTIDGCSTGFPCPIKLVVNAHPEDKEYYIKEGRNYYEPEMVINDSPEFLHDLL